MIDFATRCEEAARELEKYATKDYYPQFEPIVSLLIIAAAMARSIEEFGKCPECGKQLEWIGTCKDHTWKDD